MALINWGTAYWLVKIPILYKSVILCIELSVTNIDVDTTTFTWTGTASRMCIFYLVKKGGRVLHKYSNIDTSMRIRPLNSLALNNPNKFWSKIPGRCNPLSWPTHFVGVTREVVANPALPRQSNIVDVIAIEANFRVVLLRFRRPWTLTTVGKTKLLAYVPLGPYLKYVVWRNFFS